MIRVLLVAAGHEERFGGIERHCCSLINLFRQDSSIEIFSIDDLPSFELPIFRKRVYKWRSFIKKMKDMDFDVLHVHGYLHPCVAQAIIIGVLLKKSIVYSPHFHPYKYLRHPCLAKLFFQLLIAPLLKRVKTIVTLNREDSAYFRNFAYQMIPHWINAENDIVRTSGNSKKKTLLFVGRNDNNKGMEYLYQLPFGKYNIHCVTNRKGERKDFVYHIDVTDENLVTLYNNADLLLVPSKYEAFSLVSLEALRRGCPILVSDRVRIVDHLEGVSGVTIFKYGDYEQFINMVDVAIEQCVDIEYIKSYFSCERIKRLYKSLYCGDNVN